jgi:hypothetical protein
MKPAVLIGFADSLAAIESAWCLADCGFGVCAFTRASTRPALGRIKQVRVFPVTAPEDDALACAADLGRLIAEHGPAAVLPLDDHAVWLADRWGRSNIQDRTPSWPDRSASWPNWPWTNASSYPGRPRPASPSPRPRTWRKRRWGLGRGW